MDTLKKRYIFAVLFAIVGYGLLQIPFSQLIGSTIKFTLFDFFAPIAGAFLGPVAGVLSVAAVQGASLGIHHTPLTAFVVLRFFTVLFATLYFAYMTKPTHTSKWMLVVPALAIAAFLTHPVGRSVPYYALFWLVPFVGYALRQNVLLRALGSTMTAHAVGGAVWVWIMPTTSHYWQALVPIVIRERLLMTGGIALSYIALDSALNYLVTKRHLETLRILLPELT